MKRQLLRRWWLVLIVALVACSTGATATPIENTASTHIPSPSPLPTPTVNTSPLSNSQSIPIFTYKVVNTYPHDRTAFTEGLVLDGQTLYEGTGLNGQSVLRRVDLTTGQVLQNVALSSKYFGEGIVVWGDQILQLTWKSHIGFVYDKATFQQLKTFNYDTEGWGFTHDSQHLIMSDGTATLHFLDPETLTEVAQLTVIAQGQPVVNINELEYVQGEIWANIWQTNRIARIAPDTGQVVGWIDLTGLLTPAEQAAGVDVLNGIAYDAEHDRVFVTGKFWPKLFEIKVIPSP
ncbi:MAG: glutaminyl-peptide cyclotransferase [Anaerolineae bacterium]